jgi:hypothetical protein
VPMTQPRPVIARALSIVGGVGVASVLLVAVVVPADAQRRPREARGPLPTTSADFFQPGTQPQPDPYAFEPIQASANCSFCHSDYDPEDAPLDTWVTSLMAQSARDPVWHAALAIANQDAPHSGEFCIRCHAPGGWLAGRAATSDLSEFEPDDFDGVTCHFCHRLADPVLGPDSAVGYPENADPDPDVEVVTALLKQGLLPTGHGNARFVVDPADVRRGPFADIEVNMHGYSQLGEPVDLIYSPFHRKSDLCATCHDVSNPAFMRQPNGTYTLTAADEPHPTQNPHDMFPEQRTFSEWLNSEFAEGGVYYEDHRFGGNKADGIMSSCQDCHMPDQQGGGCMFYESPPFFERPDVPQHSFAGANTWVLDAVKTLLGEEAETLGLTDERIADAKGRVIDMLRNASDMELSQEGGELKVRVVNMSGHKLPTGYPEGRLMWLNVRFLDEGGALVQEMGAYDEATATLTRSDTKVYEARHGMDAAVARATGNPTGKSFHLALNNVVLFDNRIPPMGFSNAAFESVRAEPVGVVYPDGQHWDDTTFQIPAGAARVVVTLYYQTSTKEYMEFLLAANQTNAAGAIAYEQWVQHGRSAPVDMDAGELELGPSCGLGDVNCDGMVNGADLGLLLSAWGTADPAMDLDGNGVVDGADLGLLLAMWS